MTERRAAAASRWRIPGREELRARRGLAWLGPLLDREGLWQLNRRSVATGAALGVFFGLALPLAQMPFAAAAAVWLRGNLPVATLATLVSNPLTVGPIYWCAYRAGLTMLGADTEAFELPASFSDLLAMLSSTAGPLLLGLLVFAIGGALAVYVALRAGWPALVAWRLRRRRAAAAPRS